MAVNITGRDIETIITGGAGAVTGATFSEFVTEFVSRYFELSGNLKLVVKGTMKFIFGVIFWVLSGRFLGLPSLFFECLGYGCIASIGVDILEAFVPGGATGMAIASALKIKGASSKEISEVIETRKPATATTSVRG